jgi:hypothetical protein
MAAEAATQVNSKLAPALTKGTVCFVGAFGGGADWQLAWVAAYAAMTVEREVRVSGVRCCCTRSKDW